MRIGPDRKEGELARLRSRGLHQLDAPVSGLHGEQAGETIEIPATIDIPDVRALAAFDDRHRLSGEAGHPGEVHPQVLCRVPLSNGMACAAVGDHALRAHRYVGPCGCPSCRDKTNCYGAHRSWAPLVSRSQSDHNHVACSSVLSDKSCGY